MQFVGHRGSATGRAVMIGGDGGGRMGLESLGIDQAKGLARMFRPHDRGHR